MRTLNLGIVAHVDAGKTSLTERLLYAAGVIDEIGSVDAGTTRTDFLELERRRGITIKSAVVSFVVNGVTVNLIDTPGHPDFIAEVERVLGVLDGAVLVISAVEGVQAQTRVLMRTLRRLGIPTLVFLNKIDRAGADCARVSNAVTGALTPAIVAMGSAREAGTREAGFVAFGAADAAFTVRLADLLAGHDDALLADWLDGAAEVTYRRLRDALAAQTGRALVHPVFCGSAITGAGVDALIAGITDLLPATTGDAGGPVSGTVFKVERGPAGERVAYVRLFSGTVRTRDRLPGDRKVTAISVFERGAAVRRASVAAGQIGKLWGLGEIRIGDTIGAAPMTPGGRQFAPPALEAVVVPLRAADRGALHAALTQLAEQDPLIDLRQDDIRQELYLALYGEVQKEVIRDTLAIDYHLGVEFRDTTVLCVERPTGAGRAVEVMGSGSNPFVATVGLRVEPAAAGSGVAYRLEVELGSLLPAFQKAVEETVRETLGQGLRGWRVTDCTVTMTHSGYNSVHSTAGDFRNLTPLVLMAALRRAGTVVCEPIHHFHLEIPADTLGLVLPELTRQRAVPEAPATRGSTATLEGEVPAARVHELQLRLRALTRGEGALDCAFARYQPVRGPVPSRPRSDLKPIDRKEYLLHVARRA